MEKLISKWKKVYEKDLEYVINEMRDMIGTPCMVLLEGEVGAGKTTLLKTFFPHLEVNSPTYSVMEEVGELAHGDFYRIERGEELDHIEFPLYLDRKNYFFVEWGKRFYTHLQRQVDPQWLVFQIGITLNESTQDPSRDYVLYQIIE